MLYSSVIRGTTDGRVYQTTILVNGAVVIRDETTGITRSSPTGSAPKLAEVQKNYADTLASVVALVPATKAPKTSVDGIEAYLILATHDDGSVERLYVDSKSYLPLRTELTDGTGAVIETTDSTVFEVLDGLTTPTDTVTATVPSGVPTPSPTTTPTAQPG